MFFTGTYARVVDEKKRIVIPRQIRQQFGRPAPRRLYITPGSFQTLWIFTSEQLERFGERLLADRASRAELGAGVVAAHRRLYFSRAEPADLDSQGRILIPDRLAEHVGLGREVLLIGAFDHLELWDQQRWANYAEEYAAQFDATAEGVLHKEPPR